MTRPGGRRTLAAALLVLGCQWEDAGVSECALPSVLASSAAANPNNVLAAVVTTRVRDADSVAVRFSVGSASVEQVTPATAVSRVEASSNLPVLGLHPNTTYSFSVVAYAGCGSAEGVMMRFSTGSLPVDLPAYTAGGSDPSPGYVVFAAGFYGLVIDNTGRVVWYHRFPGGAGLNFQAQPNGRYLSRPIATSQAAADAVLVEVDPLGTITRRLGCLKGLQARPHDFIAAADGSYWVLCDDVRTVDLSVTGGPREARVMATSVQHVSGTGTMLFEWSPFDHFAMDYRDIAPADRTGSTINWTHGNALDLDGAGDLIVSFRNLDEITKIDSRTGAVLWRMGGRENQFNFSNGARAPFARQHGVRSAGAGRVLLLDNLGNPAGTSAEQYEINEAARTATLIASYGTDAGVLAELGGTTQSLPGGRTLVSFGNGGRVEEYDAAGNIVWRIDGSPGYVFRAQRIRSLYAPGAGTDR